MSKKEKVNQLIESLEDQELDAPNGLEASLYATLFSAYLYKGDLCSARYLWKRIPGPCHVDDPIELPQIWAVYQAMWLNDWPAFFAAIKYEWRTSNVAELMQELRERILGETIELIAVAYSSIFENRLADLVHLEPTIVEERCKALGWHYEDGPSPRLVRPQRPSKAERMPMNAEDQLSKLTDFVSFLEN